MPHWHAFDQLPLVMRFVLGALFGIAFASLQLLRREMADNKSLRSMSRDLRKIIRERQSVDDEALKNAFQLGSATGYERGYSDSQEWQKKEEVKELKRHFAKLRNARMN